MGDSIAERPDPAAGAGAPADDAAIKAHIEHLVRTALPNSPVYAFILGEDVRIASATRGRNRIISAPTSKSPYRGWRDPSNAVVEILGTASVREPSNLGLASTVTKDTSADMVSSQTQILPNMLVLRAKTVRIIGSGVRCCA
ncbi:hypothetical protein GGR56DRAFT_678836 [Xylariaceae sp. FL0804]|nr:hypothetical protein GGR56DRAFT_678836 [Xylariaceae sp. FL0804]